MANTIIQNIVIVDTASGNANLIDSTSGGVFKHWHINAIAIFTADTTAAMKVTGANTGVVLVYLDHNNPVISFATPQRFSDIKVPSLTATTGWFYLA